MLKAIYNEWGLDTPNGDIYVAEYLIKAYPKKISFIDRCPFLVENNNKYAQIEIMYQDVLRKNIPKELFKVFEEKLRNIITKLWLYNDLFIELGDNWVWQKSKYRIIDREYRGVLRKLVKRYHASRHLKIDDKLELELIVQLAIRDVVYVEFCFNDFRIIIIPLFDSFMVFFYDLNIKEKVKSIVMTEGLYLREAE